MVTQDLINLEALLGIPVKLSAELASNRKLTEDVLRFEVGAVIELDNSANCSVYLSIHGKPLAYGQVLAVGENLAVKVTEIIRRASA